jgi:hypothetical protein
MPASRASLAAVLKRSIPATLGDQHGCGVQQPPQPARDPRSLRREVIAVVEQQLDLAGGASQARERQRIHAFRPSVTPGDRRHEVPRRARHPPPGRRLGSAAMSDRLNPLAVESSAGPASTPPAFPRSEGTAFLWWTIVIALAPLIVDFVVTAVGGTRPISSISLFHVGVSVFGLTLAALVRILTHGRGWGLLPLLFLITVLEIAIALYSGGTFSQHAVRRSHIEGDITALSQVRPAGTVTRVASAKLAQIRDDLSAVTESEPKSTTAGYLVLAAFGIFSLIVLIRFWSGPTAPERLQAEKARNAA